MDSNVKKGIAFSKNPILLRSSLTVDDYNPITGIPFTVYASGMNQRYVGRYNQPFSVNISEIVDAYAYTIGEPIMSYHINGVREVEDNGTISERKIPRIIWTNGSALLSPEAFRVRITDVMPE